VNIRKILLHVLVGLLVVGGVGLYFAEWVEVENDAGFSKEAVRNPYLAAEKFLAQRGVESQTVNSAKLFQQLPPVDEVLIFSSSRQGMPEKKIQELISWVEAGGMLVIRARNYWDEDEDNSGDDLLDELQIGLLPGDADYDPLQVINRLNATIGQIENACSRDESLAKVSLVDEEVEISTSTADTLFYFGEEEIGYAENEFGAQIVQLDIGLGEVMVMTSFNLWNNYEIGCFDNAYLLRFLTGDTPKTWWLFHVQMPSLFELIWKNYYYTVVLGIGFILLWVWWSGFRSSEIVNSVITPRRELMEHVRGTSKFLWQQKRGDQLLRAMRDEIAVGDQQLEMRLEGLAEKSGLSEERITWAMGSRVRHNTDDFIQAVKILQKLREVK